MPLIELIEGCRQNKHLAQRTLYEQFAPAMLSLCVRYIGDYEIARDALQEGFVKVFSKIDDYNGNGSFEGWMRKIIVNTVLEMLRKSRLKNNVDIAEIEIENSDISAFEKLSAEDLLNLIASLPDSFRVIFNLHAVEEYSHKEIGEMLKIKEVTVRSNYFRAREILRKKCIEIYN
ncbi:MAG: RNA polymerase sigma factor [Paludibacter sp.]|jgi:RNA polymerase sigma-70 factor (ECF subfamily)|nr:RNA polymerase sigma factor [Paludibacter sp.]